MSDMKRTKRVPEVSWEHWGKSKGEDIGHILLTYTEVD